MQMIVNVNEKVSQVRRRVRTRYSGVPEDKKGMSANSSTSSTEDSRMEPLSPKFQMNTSTSCMVVLCSTAKVTALSESRKHRMKASRNVTNIRGFPRHRRKLYPAMEKACLIFFIAAVTSSQRGTQRETQKLWSFLIRRWPHPSSQRARQGGKSMFWGR